MHAKHRGLSLLACLLAGLLAAPAAAADGDPGLLCEARDSVYCNAEAGCLAPTLPSGEEAFAEVRLWPNATRSQQCAAASCPPLPPMLSICVATRCANGPIRFISPRAPDSSSLFAHGIATLGSEPAPRLHASELYALAWDAGSGQLALLNYDRDGQATAWFDCRPAEETD